MKWNEPDYPKNENNEGDNKTVQGIIFMRYGK